MSYHRHRTCSCLLLGDFEIKKRSIFVRLIKVKLVETANPGQEYAFLVLPHIVPRLLHHCRVRRSDIFISQRIYTGTNRTLSELSEIDCGSCFRSSPLGLVLALGEFLEAVSMAVDNCASSAPGWTSTQTFQVEPVTDRG